MSFYYMKIFKDGRTIRSDDYKTRRGAENGARAAMRRDKDLLKVVVYETARRGFTRLEKFDND